MRFRVALILAGLFTSVGIVAPGNAAADTPADVLTVTVSGAHNDTGHIGCALFRSATGFPFSDGHAARLTEVAIVHGRGTCVFSGLPTGSYAVAVMHDENGNTKLDTNFLGIPTEGFGFSNGAKGHTFSPASFDEARFTYSGGSASQSIHLEYR